MELEAAERTAARTRWCGRVALTVEALEPRGSASRVLRGDADLVHYLKEVRKHAGMMVPGPAQRAAVVALNDDDSVAVQRETYRRRLERTAHVLSKWSGIDVALPAGGFYLWFDAVDGWKFAERLAREGGALVSPGDFYGAGGANNVRVAVVQPDDKIELVAKRLGVS
ncbi:MAG: aminotransferase class I/II-fold pyridoxal phosphate-dependent enzyme [Actinobacteria bacterium]|nr:aminotransferase class I/II-fold pyridoxal phosphate-dependent enzyme [Actinomycetota bacterium]